MDRKQHTYSSLKNKIEFERVSSMKVEELKNFLRLLGLKVNGRKEELVARVFVANENNVPLLKNG